jgi:hypothetical protein
MSECEIYRVFVGDKWMGECAKMLCFGEKRLSYIELTEFFVF